MRLRISKSGWQRWRRGVREPSGRKLKRAHPDCRVRVRGEERAMRAYEAEGEERDRLWALDLTVYPTRARYAEWSGRRIPVMVLEPAG